MSNVAGGAGSKSTLTLRAMLGPELPRRSARAWHCPSSPRMSAHRCSRSLCKFLLQPSLLISSTSLLIRRSGVSGGVSGSTCVVQGKDRHGSGNHGDPEFRTQAQREPHRKLGVNWEWSNALAHNLLLTRKVVRREGIEPPTR